MSTGGESAWHRAWKALVRPEYRERIVGRRRADIVLAGDVALELQHSPITEPEISARERDYGALIWLFDAIEPNARGHFRIRTKGPYQTFRWARARRSLEAVRAPLYLDIGGDLLFHVRKMYPARPETLTESARLGFVINPPSPCAGWGYVLTKDDFIRRYLRTILA